MGYKPNKAVWLDSKWAGLERPRSWDSARQRQYRVESPTCAISGKKITGIRKLPRPPRPRSSASSDHRAKSIESGDGIDWSTAEALLARCSRKAIRYACPARTEKWHFLAAAVRCCLDQRNKGTHAPLDHVLRPETTRFEVLNWSLSEEAVLGFEYGYSAAEPNALGIGRRSSAISPTARWWCSISSSRRGEHK